jgi:hypothetical protein
MSLLTWLPTCLHWPFCPGVFITVLAFATATATFRKEPSRTEKRIWLLLFFGLMVAEVGMISKDRDAHDAVEADARKKQNEMLTHLNVLQYQSADSGRQLDLIRQQLGEAREEHNPSLVADLKVQEDKARKKALQDSTELLAAMASGVADEMSGIMSAWTREYVDITNSYLAHKYPSYDQDVRTIAKRYLERMRPVMRNADYLREQLLQRLPPAQRMAPDLEEPAIFAKVIAGEVVDRDDVNGTVAYLRGLGERVSRSVRAATQ